MGIISIPVMQTLIVNFVLNPSKTHKICHLRYNTGIKKKKKKKNQQKEKTYRALTIPINTQFCTMFNVYA